ncbi:MAG: nickel pincer cofactor biosynthesis protein LarC [Dorea sp.]
MKTLYLDCGMGAAGDMLSAALLELHPEPEQFIERLNRLGIPKVEFQAETAVKCGITGTHMTVKVDGKEEVSADHHEEAHHHEHHYGEHSHHHDHHNMQSITAIVGNLDIQEEVKKDILAVYDLIAQAESHVHGCPVDEIHFHEVGSMDAVADVTAVCLLMHELKPERVVASPVHVGSGYVHCAHGILPVPAPATAWILQDIPTYGGKVRGELCTPTGAALLKYFVQEFGSQPPMRVEGIGYGCGQKEFEVANCVRAMCGETADNQDYIVELRCNLDDMTPEAVGFAMEELFAAGALDVYTTAVGMKKNRPGILLTCMCKEKQREEMIRLLFLHTTTLGVRESVCNRYTLKRTMKTETTVYGNVRIKEVSGWGIKRQKAEYEDLARIAREQEMPIAQVRECVMALSGMSNQEQMSSIPNI